MPKPTVPIVSSYVFKISNDATFNRLINGQKISEIRCFINEFDGINIGDKVSFKSKHNQFCHKTITNIIHSSTIEDLYNKLIIVDKLFNMSLIDFITIYHKTGKNKKGIYTSKKIETYGIMAFCF
jgi:ASC-1-like (ASCH) protein